MGGRQCWTAGQSTRNPGHWSGEGTGNSESLTSQTFLPTVVLGGVGEGGTQTILSGHPESLKGTAHKGEGSAGTLATAGTSLETA